LEDAPVKSALIALVILALLAAESCSDSRKDQGGQTPATSTRPTEAASAPATAPASAPARTLSLHDGMSKVEDSDLEGSLESWAEGKDIDFEKVIKRTSVYLDIAGKVRWNDNKKRERDPADHDRIVRESIEKATALVEAARAKNEAQVKERSELLIRRCTDCHNKYK
jgi:hypothetical protein